MLVFQIKRGHPAMAFSTYLSLLQNPESEFDFFAARGEMEGAGAPFLA
jgi:hypothetical protein